MSEWTVVTIIVTLTGFIIAVISPIVKLNATITRITTNVSALEKDIATLQQSNGLGHDRIWESKKEQDKQVADLEIRLAVLENAQK